MSPHCDVIVIGGGAPGEHWLAGHDIDLLCGTGRLAGGLRALHSEIATTRQVAEVPS